MTLAEFRKGKDSAAAVEPHEEHGVATEHHPGALEYFQIGAILAVITAIEVAIYYMGLSHTLLVMSLIVLSVVKFTMVVLWFMHLKFDHRLFSSMFLIGLLLALVIFTVATSTIGGKLV